MRCVTEVHPITEADSVIGAHIRSVVSLGDLMTAGTGRAIADGMMRDARRRPDQTGHAYGLSVTVPVSGMVTVTVHADPCTCEGEAADEVRVLVALGTPPDGARRTVQDHAERQLREEHDCC